MDLRMRPSAFLLVCSTLLLWGCGGSSADVGVGITNSSTGQLSGPTGAIGQQLSAFEILDIQSGTTTTATAIPDLTSKSAYYTSEMVFRRVHGLQNDYFLGVFAITQGQWKLLNGGGTPWTAIDTSVVPAPASGTDTDSLPASNISFSLISSAVQVYNLTAHAQLSLPTLRQWQFACAAGTDPTFWSWGSSRDPAVWQPYANLLDNQMPPSAPSPIPTFTPVGSLLPNAFGFYDMHGNIWQWVTPGPHICGGSFDDGIDQARTDNVAGSDTCVVTDQTSHALIGARLVLSP